MHSFQNSPSKYIKDLENQSLLGSAKTVSVASQSLKTNRGKDAMKFLLPTSPSCIDRQGCGLGDGKFLGLDRVGQIKYSVEKGHELRTSYSQ